MRNNHFESFLMFIFFVSLSMKTAIAQNSTTIPVNVGVILNLDVGFDKMVLSCIKMSISDFYSVHGDRYKTRLVLAARNSRQDVVGAAAAGLDLIKNVEVEAILGPPTSMQANFVIDMGAKAQVPIISFTASSPSLSSLRSPFFFQATQNDATQVKAIRDIVKAFRWREVVPVYVDNEFGGGIIPFLTDALQAVDVRVPYRSAISSTATDDELGEELYKLMAMQTRVFIVHMSPSLGSRLFIKADEVGMMGPGCVWIITDGLADFWSSMNSSVVDSMQGALGVQPYVPKTKELTSFRNRFKRKFVHDNPNIVDADLNVYGLWAYDAITALAMAVEKAGTTNLGFQKPNVSSNSTDLENFGLSLSGLNLLQALSDTSFKGLSGNFSFVNGQLKPSPYEIINVNGDGARGIGFWTAENGLIRKLNTPTNNTTSTYSTSNSSLAPIMWPGETTYIPKGWEIPTNGKRLRIGVPVDSDFAEFVKVRKDPTTNSSIVEGYCIDVFEAAVKLLPYALPFDYFPFELPDGRSAGTYNDLVYQVYLGNYDAVVGDTTIRLNRSNYVDFTLPYTESGVSMVVPVKDINNKNAWIFLKPLTWDLWFACFCFFVFIGFVIWVLEHRINEEFRGPFFFQVGTSFWFSFSTMVFAPRERLVSNLARFVIVIWCFVVLILTQSYTASLTSLLTVQKLQPTVTDVKELIRTGAYVGYLQGSFVLGLLKNLGFDESKLLVYRTLEEWDALFTKGSGNGGIAAAFDEVPYINLFLAKYCSKYTTVEPTFKTDGFGFVFPKDSPLVSDVSRAILGVTEGETMKKIEEEWFGKEASCPDPGTSLSSKSLGIESFWGLFLITGGVSVLALIIYLVVFIHEQWDVITSPDYKSLRQRAVALFWNFYNRDFSAHTIRRNEVNDQQIQLNETVVGEPSPSAYSVQTEFLGEQDRVSSENDDRNSNDQQQLQETLLNSPAIQNHERPRVTEIMQD
ncbi:hypothetical protein K2173_000264 [Erythroxylum novogranatense]|uniref:Glutamate receptor n=1 Tax=Erythroxylum novogranatense TaxID=1862640 RepID=A0AAV8SWN7_9ROSI|nr:hypothetical protein K2173_000264 [Erythroxylum novogranatense]